MIKPIHIHNDTAYEIIRVKQIDRFFDKEQRVIKDNVKLYRDWLRCDHVLQNATQFLFCNTIQDVSWEDVVEPETEESHE
jgi:hypothetical protein